MKTPRRLVREGVREWSAARRRVLDGDARDEDVHEWRVATRRMLALEALFVPARERGRLERMLRRAFRAAGRLRDAQVCVALASGEGGAALASAGLARSLRSRLPKLRHRLLRRLREVAPREVRSEAQRELGEGAQAGKAARSPDAARAAGRRLAAALRDVDRERARLDPRSPAQALHRLRIRVKRARYMLKAAQAAGIPTPGAGAARSLVTAQRRLGAIADLEALLVAAERHARRSGRRDAALPGVQRAIESRRDRLGRRFLAAGSRRP